MQQWRSIFESLCRLQQERKRGRDNDRARDARYEIRLFAIIRGLSTLVVSVRRLITRRASLSLPGVIGFDGISMRLSLV